MRCSRVGLAAHGAVAEYGHSTVPDMIEIENDPNGTACFVAPSAAAFAGGQGSGYFRSEQ
jgi:hypothetical protein